MALIRQKNVTNDALPPRFSMAVLFYNEEANITPVVTSLRQALTDAGLDCELILVDNGSKDRTSAYSPAGP